MISDEFFIYLIFQLILLALNIVGFAKMPVILIFTAIGTFITAISTVLAFGDYQLIAIMLIITNISIPVIGVTKVNRGE